MIKLAIILTETLQTTRLIIPISMTNKIFFLFICVFFLRNYVKSDIVFVSVGLGFADALWGEDYYNWIEK